MERGQLTREQAAYNICGATRYDELAAVPELDEIIDMACELEIPAKQRKDKVGWSDLASAIGELPDSLRAS